jgi:triacylglycerol lipase
MPTIVLAAGIARPDILLARLGFSGVYFNGIAKHLRDSGFTTVIEPVVSFAGSVDERAGELAKAIRGLDEVHIIAHSMGGLDARHVIVDHPDAAAKVRSLTTIGTPHLGTPFADRGTEHPHPFLDFISNAVHISLAGFDDLTTAACRAFNDKARAAEQKNTVKYRAVSAKQTESATFALLRPSHRIISRSEGENDGLVSVTSARWTDNGLPAARFEAIDFPMPADHINEVGWDTDAGKVRAFYLELARSAAKL